MKTTPYLSVENLSYRYPDGTLALRELSFELAEGDFVALIGQNGSGKTTASKCLNGLFKPTEGRVIVDGLDTRTTSITKMVVRVGYVFQNPDHQLFNSNVWDEIAYGPRNIQFSEEEVTERVEEAAKVVGLNASYFTEHPFFLPKGLRQRVAIASILALRPKVIIVDEPTTGQDVKQSLEIMDFLTYLHQERGHIIVIITHDMPIVSRYAKRIVLLGQGRKLADGPTSEVFAQPQILAETFVAPPQITQLAQATAELGFDPGTLRVNELLTQFEGLVA
ncbi:MAG TPA: ATP-binding cassette domain-containing protein [Thermoflexia bacterium]|nr:ATP-binding cassette domain-containing protein [Thermoflexia bacterium]